MIINQMSQYSYKKYSNSSIAEPKTKKWIEEEQMNLMIHSRFADLNQRMREKVQQQQKQKRQNIQTKNIVTLLQQKIEKNLAQYQDETTRFREILSSISKKTKQAQISHKERVSKTRQRLKQIRVRVEMELARQRYTSEHELSNIEILFSRSFTALKSRQKDKNPIRNIEIIQQKQALEEELVRNKKQNQQLCDQSSKYLQNILVELQKKIQDWNKKMLKQNLEQQQLLTNLTFQINKAEQQLKQQLQKQANDRQQSKQKLLMLLQTRYQQLFSNKK